MKEIRVFAQVIGCSVDTYFGIPSNIVITHFSSFQKLKFVPTVTAFFIVGLLSFATSTEIKKNIFGTNPSIRLWTEADGLFSENPLAAHQASDGFIWIGSYEGLIRFDGIEFKQFSSQTHKEILHSSINVIHESNDGTIWFAGSGPGIYRYDHGKISAWAPEDGLNLEMIVSITSDSDGRIAMCSPSKVSFIETDDRIGTIIEVDNEEIQLNCIEYDSQNRLWLGSNKGLYQLINGKLINYTSHHLSSQRVKNLVATPNGDLWVSTYEGNVYLLREDRLEKKLQGRMGEHSASLSIDRDNNIWVSGLNGFHQFDGENFLERKISRLDHLSPVRIQIHDNEGGMWLTGSDLRLLQIRKSKFEYYSATNGLPNFPVSGATRVGDNIYLSTFDGLYTQDGQTWKKCSISDQLTDGICRMIANLGDDELLLVSQRYGIVIYDVKTGTASHIAKELGLPSNEVRQAQVTQNGDIWIGTEYGVFVKSGDTISKQLDIPAKKIISISETADGSIWCGIYGEGVFRVKDGKISQIQRTDGLSSNVVFNVVQQSDDVFWVSTNAGLSQISGDSVISINSQNGLPRDSVFHTTADAYGFTWIATNPGFYRVPTQELNQAFKEGSKITSIDFYDRRDGIASSEMFAPSKAYTDPVTQKIWLPSTKGIVVVDPAKIPPNLPAPNVYIETMEIDGEEIQLSGNNINQIPPQTKRVTINFSAPSFYSPSDIQFRIKLNGFDTNWSETSDRKISYSNLKPGQYTFEVYSCSSDGEWSETPVKFSFRKLPKFSETIWAKLALLLIILIFAGAVAFLVNYRLELRKRILERKVRERTKELQEALDGAESANHAKSNFLAMMSHEIRTPMNGVIGMLDILLDGNLSKNDRNHAVTAQRSARSLMSIWNDVLDLAKIESQKLELEEINFSLSETIRDAIRIIEPVAIEKGIKLKTDITSIENVFLIGDFVRVRQILINLISNGTKFTEVGSVEVSAKLLNSSAKSTQFEVRVADTGIGISDENQKRIFSVFDQGDVSYTRKYGGSGLGLSICKTIVEQMNGNITCESEIGKGSTFSFVLELPNGEEPINKELGISAFTDEAQNQASLKILLAEDIQFNQKIISHLVTKLGHKIHCVSNGIDALSALKSEDFDLVLMDISMPDMDGVETTQKIRSGMAGKNQKIPIVALTANAMQGDREKFLASGMDSYLAKPIDRKELAQILNYYAITKACKV